MGTDDSAFSIIDFGRRGESWSTLRWAWALDYTYLVEEAPRFRWNPGSGSGDL